MYPANARKRFMSDGVSVVPSGRLLIMLYERLARDLDDAEAAIVDGLVPPAHEALTHAQTIVDELSFALDPVAWPEATHLAELYNWLNGRLVQANLTKDAALVADCRQVVAPLLQTWREAYDLRAAAEPVAAGA